ncbi:MAG: RNA polymerase sigma factor [candidate division Zixibacteria bacterium]
MALPKINILYELALNGGDKEQEQLFEALSVRFRLFAYQRIWGEDDAKEVVQDALMTVLSEYRQIQIESSFSAWAYQVLKFRIQSHIRKKQRQGERLRPLEEDDGQAVGFTVDPILENSLLDCLRKMGKVNSRYARILNLKYQGHSAADICSRLQIKPNNLYVLLHRARTQLKNCLDDGELTE